MKIQESIRGFKTAFPKEPEPVVCGTDFSDGATVAKEAAATLARRFREPMVLLHAYDPESEWQLGDAATEVRRRILERLETECKALETKYKIKVYPALVGGLPDEALVEYSRLAHAKLIVLSALGQRTPAKWILGSVAERTAQITKIPLLLVRDSKPFASITTRSASAAQTWLVAYDQTRPSESALRWLAPVARALKPRLLLVHVGAVEAADIPDLEESLRKSARRFLPRIPFSVLVQPAAEDAGFAIARLAKTANAGVVVTGTHQRSTIKRWWYGSTSQHLLHTRATNVLVVPTI